MVTCSSVSLSSFRALSIPCHNQNHPLIFPNTKETRNSKVLAAKAPSGIFLFPSLLLFWVEFPKVEPKFKAPFAGFTKTAETWNSRACMIGLIGTFIVELIINKGILQVLGVDIGKGLDIPL